MFASYNWLKEYVDFDLSPEILAEKMTLHGLEVVSTQPVNQAIDGLAIGEVLEKKQHPNADRLSTTLIKYLDQSDQQSSEKIVPVVCGAANIAAGQKIVLATVGTKLAPDFVIKASKIRGEESVGMVCSKEELGLEESSEGIWALPEDTRLDTDPQTLIGKPDWIFEIDITSNRPDCQNILGVAREVSAILGLPLSQKSEKSFTSNQQNRFKVEVENSELCPRYMAIKISKVSINESPEWLKNRLNHHGVRPINNVVDITNLMMLEYGQPLHAFDLQKLDEKIVVRNAVEGEKFLTLDQQELTLTANNLVIADISKAIALAGVMGGDNSAIQSTTTDILLEAAVFNANSVRQTSKQHKLYTDAAFYFERRVELENTPYVLDQAVQLLLELTGGAVESPITDTFQTSLDEKHVLIRFKNVSQVLGIHLSKDKIADLLKRLKFKIKASNEEHLEVIVPSFRNDIHYEWDLIEEVARVYGYNNIPEELPKITNSNFQLENQVYQSIQETSTSSSVISTTSATSQRKKSDLIKQIRQLSLGMGYHEIISYPFFENQWAEKTYPNLDHFVRPENPFWVDISLLRDQLLFGILRAVKLNHEKGNHDFNQAFEIGRVFYHAQNTQNYLEEEHFSFALWGEKTPFWLDQTTSPLDFYQLKGDLEAILSRLGFKNWSLELIDHVEHNLLVPHVAALIKVNNVVVGTIGLVHPNVLKVFDLNFKIFYVELNLERLVSLPTKKTKYQKSSVFPSVHRDLAIVINDDTSGKAQLSKILSDIKKSSKLVQEVIISSLYNGENIESGKCSVVFNIKLQSHDRTLERKEADQEISQLVEKLQKKYIFQLR